MAIQFFVYIATSLEGFIARENGDLDWLPQAGDEDYGYQHFFDSIDTLLIGRGTFEKALTFDPCTCATSGEHKPQMNTDARR